MFPVLRGNKYSPLVFSFSFTIVLLDHICLQFTEPVVCSSCVSYPERTSLYWHHQMSGCSIVLIRYSSSSVNFKVFTKVPLLVSVFTVKAFNFLRETKLSYYRSNGYTMFYSDFILEMNLCDVTGVTDFKRLKTQNGFIITN